MKKRMLIMLAVVGVFLVAIGSYKFLQIKAAIAAGAAWAPPPEAVTTIVAKDETWPATLSPIGTVAAVQGVMVSADLPGVVQAITFESGRHVHAGETLVRLDTSQEKAQLAAAAAQSDLARSNYDRAKQLLDKQVISQAEFDQSAATLKADEARVGEIRAVIERKQIRAPFDGTLGIRKANLGQYLAGGDPVVTLQSMDPVYVNFSVPQQHVGDLRLGAPVRVSADSLAGVPRGRVTAVNSQVDESTRNVQVQATFDNPRGRLKPGMFVDVEVSVGASDHVITLPASAISYAPYGNSVFIVTDMKGPNGKTYRGVEQRFVKLGAGRGDQVAVIAGVKAGDEVVTSGVFKLRNGAAVLVNNKVLPSNNPAPKPEDS
jgi:membrane fusion protein (multidrug efflux system)